MTTDSNRRPLLAFDVNETLLDLAGLDDEFRQRLGDAGLRTAWFQMMLQLAFVGGVTGQYVDFTTAQREALTMIAQRAGRTPADADVAAIVDHMRDLPPHAEVPAALARLHDAGFRMVALTNSPLDVARDQIANAGIASSFDDVISADEVRALKPAPEPYRLVAERNGIDISDVCLVAAHGWDITGALAAGATAAFVARPGAMLSALGPRPAIVVADIAALATELLDGPHHADPGGALRGRR
jgi:2-haloacid dehalogenase